MENDDEFSLQAKITVKQSLIRQLKKDSAPSTDIAAEVEILTSLRSQLAVLTQSVKEVDTFNRKAFDELV